MTDASLSAVRFVHLTATLLIEGAVVFRFCIAEPALRRASDSGSMAWLRPVTAVAWSVMVLSGAAWVAVLGGEIGDLPTIAAWRQGIDWTLLRETQFGAAWQWRAGVAAALALALLLAEGRGFFARWSAAGAIALALALSGSLAWSGHGAATPGRIGDLHLAADILHLLASGLWLGGLLPFALIMAQAMRGSLPMASAAEITGRFSNLATASVATLLLSGIVNGWVLVGSVPALADTLYGRLLLAKIALFVVMLAFAAVNRIGLAPRLAQAAGAASDAAGRLAVHAFCELTLGAAILGVVGVLGALPPAVHPRHVSMSHPSH